MVITNSEMKRRNDFPQNLKRRKVDVVRDFPDGCGSLASSTCQSKFEEGDNAKHIQNAAAVKKVESISVPGMRKWSHIKRDFPTRGTFVSHDPFPSLAQSSESNNSNLPVENKLSGACINYDADAFGMCTTLIRKEQLNDDSENQKCNNLVMDEEAIDSCKKVKEALDMYHKILSKLLHNSNGKKMQSKFAGSTYFIAAKMLFKQEKWVKFVKQTGPIPGVQVGDKFQRRAELKVVGLHNHFIRGIDYMKNDGKLLATSVVDSHRYENDNISSGVLIYSGEGGNPLIGVKKKLVDQKYEQGNLALMNCKESKALVRVIRHFKISRKSSHIGLSGKRLSNTMYVYDGLYIVDEYWQERGKFGKLVFKFRLKRALQQPKLNFQELRLMGNSKCSKIKKDVVRMNDISQGKEKVPIRLKNTVDEEKLPSFDYITSIIYPKYIEPVSSNYCSCVDGCGDLEKCNCILKNGGEWPYNSKGCNVTSNSIIYECGPCCKCSDSCTSRLTQNGIFLQLEVFKTGAYRWGVRSRSYISKGSFLCEYIGEVLHDKEIQNRINNLYSKRSCEGGSVCLLTYSQVSSFPTDSFTIDATLHGNVARFINHSNSPNLRAQYVLYDHSDVKVPHVMLFANKDVPPLQELTYDYSSTLNKFGLVFKR
ncbi:histone-lysine N-methyltransferase, H3 lysine-9 specific SUVH6-like [Humulus lupulus]|uniref:histone-lysine N-methyltransferase, H3 lysine-9 specific SUVH6-like n=1 Tax=Humulus lupulus TaxID=3486 RepID=UPI002B403B62|nr:histone-lysine N-methyltransferase, H3 lysine-9 specific SUVH6-like [Humulus lupulus]